MSALGQKRTLTLVRLMSALPPRADIEAALGNVRFVPIADIGSARWLKWLSMRQSGGTRCHSGSAAQRTNPKSTYGTKAKPLVLA
jgi:hypothetical protein